MPPDQSLSAAIAGCLALSDPWRKSAAARDLRRAFEARPQWDWGDTRAPDRPGRPARPPLLAPRDLPKRRISAAPEGRIALLHALAHIELNAVDLSLDLALRFAAEAPLTPGERRRFLDDWLSVADDEAKHFLLLSGRIEALGAAYGDLPAHDGLWRTAEATADDLLARLAVVPMVLEARGLDVTPGMIQRLQAAGDAESAAALEVIYEDEIGHVSIGRRWFQELAGRQGLDPLTTWQALVRRHAPGALKPPFNDAARHEAGLTADYYAHFSTSE